MSDLNDPLPSTESFESGILDSSSATSDISSNLIENQFS